MSKLLLMTVGASGSGKNRLKDNLSHVLNIVNVEPDEIRRELWGDVNEQKRGDKVWAVAEERINKALKNDSIVLFNATNLNYSRNKKFVEQFNCKTLYIFMMDSQDKELCKIRVNCDIENGKDRSKVPEELIDSMCDRFGQCLLNTLKEDRDKVFMYHDSFSTLIDWIKENA